MDENYKSFVDLAISNNRYRQHDANERGVLMVTITLAEYRELVAAKAKAEGANEIRAAWQYQQEIATLKGKIAELACESAEE